MDIETSAKLVNVDIATRDEDRVGLKGGVSVGDRVGVRGAARLGRERPSG
jgi:hypothetical protein